MKVLVVVVLVCLTVGSDASPTIARKPSSSAGFMGISFADFMPYNWIIYSPSSPASSTSTTNSASLTTINSAPITTNSAPVSTNSPSLTIRAAENPIILRRRVNVDRSLKPIVFGTQPRAVTPSSTTEATTSSSGEDEYNEGRVVFPGERLDITIDKPGCPSTPVFPPLVEETNSTECSLARGTIMYNGSCSRLLAGKHCAEGEWLVKVGVEEAKCRLRPCPFGQLEYNGTCVNSSDTSVCGYGQILYVDMTGETQCDCEPNFIYDPSSGNCYSQYEQGPCSYGNYMILTKSCSVECVFNDCEVDGYVRDSVSNDCYRKMYHGFCETDMQVFHQVNHTIECAAIVVRNIFDVATLRSCPTGSRHDHLGKCREVFRVPSVTSLSSLYGKCSRSDFAMGPRNVCRRTHNLFG